RQQPGESVEEYFRAMRRLGNRLITPIPESEMVRIVKKGLTADIARFVYALRVYSVEQLREECLEVEEAFMKREVRPIYRGPSKFQPSGRQVEEVAVDGPEVEAGMEDPIVEEQAMYLGIDFWRRFALAPAILGEMPAQNPEASVSELWDATNPWLDGKAIKESVIEEWDLQQIEKNRLEAVKKEFLAFEDVGLGRTSVEKHRIQLVEGAEPFKDRHYPLSPAMQEIVWAEYLGFIIGGGTLRMDPERIVAIQKIPEPKSVKELRSFLGTAGWYRRFIKDFAAMATPLTDALKKGKTTRLVLGEEAKSAIQ
ncbi:hypothetical protein KR059_005893, partial [Drosophila kikkawai]